jgi:hypothetical protein
MSKTATPFIKRPTTGRTGPTRGPETVFRQASPSARNPDIEELEDLDDDLDGDLGDDDDHEEARLSMESARLVADKHDPYRTRPDDMRRGYDHWSRSAGSRGQSRGGREGREGGDLLELTGLSTRALSRLISVWVDLLGPLLPPGLGRAGRSRRLRYSDELGRDDPADERGGRGQRVGRADEVSMALEVTSKRPVRVSLELDRGIAPEPLRVRPLRVPGTKEPAIRGAIVDVDGLDRVVVHIVVPDHLPSGAYEGAVLTSDGRVRLGRLRVLVRDTPGGPAV